jgi:peptidoglycan/LPS O-acetylase OafA/YrhL
MGVSADQKSRWARRVDRNAGTFVAIIIGLSALQIIWDIDLLGYWWMQGVFPYSILVVIVGLSISSPEGHPLTQRLLNWSPLLFLGRISLPLYLVHEPIIQYIAWVARPSQPWSFITPMPVAGIAVVLPVSLILAVVLHRNVETPARDYLRSRWRGK